MGELLEVGVIPDIHELSWTKEPFEHPSHIDVHERMRLIVTEQEDRVGDVLADTGQSFDFVAGSGEPSAPGGDGGREGFEARRSLCGKADGPE